MNNSKKQNKTIKWERLEISSRKLERSRERFMQGWTQYRNGRDLTEVEGIKRWQENTEERAIKKCLSYSDNHHGVVSHPEPDILECEVKWALGSITSNKAGGGHLA